MPRLRTLRGVLLLGITVLVFCYGASVMGATNFMPVLGPNGAGISDLVLIYQGGTHRPAWEPEELAPYASWTNVSTAKEEWLFDGFLFIEFKDNRGREYAKGYGQKSARQQDWAWLLERNCETNRGIAALNQVTIETAKRLGPPARPRQVILTLPEPIAGQKDWGTLNGHPLDFDRSEDRIAACEWHINTALEYWRKLSPQHLKLAGFYWVAEHSTGATSILPEVARKIHDRGLRFFWIPYWRAAGAQSWRTAGFDVAYQQPNHFFHAEVPDSRLAEACAFARTNGMGLEMEFDSRAITSAEVFRPRLAAYLRAFEQADAARTAAVAWYEGGGALLSFSRSTDPAIRQLYADVAGWVANRQHAVDKALLTR